MGEVDAVEIAGAVERRTLEERVQRAGVASGRLSTVRNIGASMGVAIVGSLVASGYRSDLATTTRALDLSPGQRDAARESISGALEVANDTGGSAGEGSR